MDIASQSATSGKARRQVGPGARRGRTHAHDRALTHDRTHTHDRALTHDRAHRRT